jgi:hypothetical protein
MENLENLTELPISSQEFIKNDWKLLKNCVMKITIIMH